jgi:hypothetical protein
VLREVVNIRNIVQISLTMTLVVSVIVAILLVTGNTTALVVAGAAYVVTFAASGVYLLGKRRARRNDAPRTRPQG